MPSRLRRLAPFFSVAPIALAATAQAQISLTDFFLVHSGSGMSSSVAQYDGAGAVVHTIDALTTDPYTSAALTPDGNFAIHRGSDTRIEIRAYDGTLLQEFEATYTYGSGQDVAVFDDGTIAICARQHGVMLYAQSGAWLGALVDSSMDTPLGCYHAPDDTVWIADSGSSTPGSGRVLQFDRAGSVLQAFDVDFDVSDIVEDGGGNLWMSSLYQGRIYQFTRDGDELSSFDVQFDTPSTTLWSLAISGSGGIIAVGEDDSTVRVYGTTGAVLDEFDITTEGRPLYVFTTSVGGVGTRYCFGDGTGAPCPCGNSAGVGEGCLNSTGAGATLFGAGSASVSQDTLACLAENLPAGQPALLFGGENDPGDGHGVVFGDGLRCAGASVVRLGVQIPDSSGTAAWGPGLASQAGWSSGDVRYLQVWYRDPVGGPCGLDFNLTNGLAVELYD